MLLSQLSHHGLFPSFRSKSSDSDIYEGFANWFVCWSSKHWACAYWHCGSNIHEITTGSIDTTVFGYLALACHQERYVQAVCSLLHCSHTEQASCVRHGCLMPACVVLTDMNLRAGQGHVDWEVELLPEKFAQTNLERDAQASI